MNTTKEKIEVMQAYLDGKTVQMKCGNNWCEVRNKNPSWDWANGEYRIEPEPQLLAVADLPLGIKTVTLVFQGGAKAIVIAWSDEYLQYYYNGGHNFTIGQLHNSGVKWSVDGGKTALTFEKIF